MELSHLLKNMTEKGASDMHLRPMTKPILRIDGTLSSADYQPLTIEEIEAVASRFRKACG